MLSVCVALAYTTPGRLRRRGRAGKALRRLGQTDYAYVQMPFSSLFEREKIKLSLMPLTRNEWY